MSNFYCESLISRIFFKKIAIIWKKTQFFQDVDCKEEKSAEAILVNGTSTTTVVAKSVGTNGTEPEENEEFDDSFVANLTDSSGNVNVSEITADEVSCFFFKTSLHNFFPKHCNFYKSLKKRN